MFLAPTILTTVFLMGYLLVRTRKYRLSAIRLIKQKGVRELILKGIDKLLPKDSKLYKIYAGRILKHSGLSVEAFVQIKLVIFISVLTAMVLIKYTNISIQTGEIFTRYNYRTDLFYEYKGKIDEQKAYAQEIDYFKAALATMDETDVSRAADDVQQKIIGLMKPEDSELLLPKKTMANKIYHRLADYYAIRKFNLGLYLLIALTVSFIPEVYLFFKNILAAADTRRELRFLKKLVIMNGSIKPVDFMEVLGILIEKSQYYKKVLKEIEDKNKRNSLDARAIYSAYIKGTKDIDVKLFFEKLDEANNYDFDQAVKNIQNEFKLQLREDIRKVRKRIEFIHIVGILGFMVIILILVLYLIEPWLRMYNINQLGI